MPRAMRTVELSPKEEVGPGQWRKTRDYALAKKKKRRPCGAALGMNVRAVRRSLGPGRIS